MENPKRPPAHLRVDERIILKWIFRQMDERARNGFI
jgi:hypothetical protein